MITGLYIAANVTETAFGIFGHLQIVAADPSIHHDGVSPSVAGPHSFISYWCANTVGTLCEARDER